MSAIASGMAAATIHKNQKIMVKLLNALAIIIPAVTIVILYSLPLQAWAQYTMGTPYPYTPSRPGAVPTMPPYTNMPTPTQSYPYTQMPQQQPVLPAVPGSPSSPQYIIPSPQNPQQMLPPQSSSSLPMIQSPQTTLTSPSPSSASNDTTVTNTTNTTNMLNSTAAGSPLSASPFSSASPASQPMSSIPPPQSSSPTPSPYPIQQQQPQLASLIVVTRLNDTNSRSTSGNTSASLTTNNNLTASFPQVVTNAYANPDGYTVVYHFLKGSESGVVLNLQPGVYSVADQSSNNGTSNNDTSNKTTAASSTMTKLPSSSASLPFMHTYSGDCTNVKSIAGGIVGYGQINLGESKTCIITYSNKNQK